MIQADTRRKLRDSLIRAAREMLEESDTPLDLRKVAERVGKSRTAPYLVFGKREAGGGLEALRIAVAVDGLKELVGALEEALASASKPDATLFEVSRAYLLFAHSQPRLFRLMFGPEVTRAMHRPEAEQSSRPEVPELLLARREVDQLIGAALKSAQPADPGAAGEARTLALGFRAMLHGAAMLSLDGQAGLSGDPPPDQAAALVTAFFRPKPPTSSPMAAAEEAFSVAQIERGREPRDSHTSSAIRRAKQARASFQGSHILWIADDLGRAAAEQRTLESLGAKLSRARDTLGALGELHGMQSASSPRSFDVIVSDVARHDSGTGGADELPLLKRAAPTTPVIFYVARLEPDTRRPAGSLGITDDPGELLHLVLDVLQRKRP
jgi:hypothetical protein